jgi:hypothetical protein
VIDQLIRDRIDRRPNGHISDSGEKFWMPEDLCREPPCRRKENVKIRNENRALAAIVKRMSTCKVAFHWYVAAGIALGRPAKSMQFAGANDRRKFVNAVNEQMATLLACILQRLNATMSDRNDSKTRLLAHSPEPVPQWHLFLDRIRLQPDLFSDESLAPTVEWDLLRALVRQQLSDVDARLVQRLIVCFESWRDAHNAVLIEELPPGHGHSA